MPDALSGSPLSAHLPLAQTAHVLGHHNLIVQIQGDGNRVFVGHPYLCLATFANPPAPGNPMALLTPASRSIPLLGRQAELDDLNHFVQSAAHVAARVVVAGGGAGKTRLALEMCDRLRGQGWHAGFATHPELKRFQSQQNAAQWGWSKPTLVVIDYASAVSGWLSEWFAELVQNPMTDRPPLRFLLLERSASAEWGWMHHVFGVGEYGAEARTALLDPREPVPLQSLPMPSRLEVLNACLKALPHSRVAELLSTDETLQEKLRTHRWAGDALYLMMAALQMAESGNTGALDLNRTDLALYVAGHEDHRLSAAADGATLSRPLMRHLAVCAVLSNGTTQDAFVAFAAQEIPVAGWEPSVGAQAMAHALQRCLNPAGGSIGTIQPDLIGEAFIVKTLWDLYGGQPAAQDQLMRRCHQHFGDAVVATLVRCAEDFEGIGSDTRPVPSAPHGSPLRWLQALEESVWDHEDLLGRFDTQIPDQTVVLRPLKFRVAKQRVALMRSGEDVSLDHRWNRWNQLAIASGDLGEMESALQAADIALDIARQMADHATVSSAKEIATAVVATSLNNRANWLSHFGRDDAALRDASAALSLWRWLARERPEIYLPDLAMSLGNRANRLSALGSRVEALQDVGAAIDLFRQFTQVRPDVYLPKYAALLNNRATMFSELTCHEDALRDADKATTLYRLLAQARREVFLPDLAMALCNRARAHSDLAQGEYALRDADEGVDLRRQLVQARPESFLPDLAMSLNNRATVLRDLARKEDALRDANEAVDLHRQLAQRHSDAYIPKLAMSLTNRAAILGDRGDREHAERDISEAIDLRRPLAESLPEVYGPDLARSLMLRVALNAGDALGDAADAQEALEALAPQFLKHPESVKSLMVLCLQQYLPFAQQGVGTFDPGLLGRVLANFNQENPES